jgi:hypothetical protein
MVLHTVHSYVYEILMLTARTSLNTKLGTNQTKLNHLILIADFRTDLLGMELFKQELNPVYDAPPYLGMPHKS